MKGIYMIDFSKVNLQFTKDYYALCNVSLKIEDGKKICLLGEKDSGKTSILRIIAGLEKDYTGDVFINGKSQKELDYKYDVSVGYVPKKGVFFEHKTVKENMLYALSIRNSNMTPYESEELINNVLTKFDLINNVDMKVKKLNNVQRYLLAFARLNLRKINILLVDNIWDLPKDELESIKKALQILIEENECTVIVSSEKEEYVSDLGFEMVKIHAGIID